MQIQQLFQLHCAFRSLRLLAGDLNSPRHFYHIIDNSHSVSAASGDLLFTVDLHLPEETPRLLSLIEQSANSAGIVVRAPSSYRPPELEEAAAANGGLPVLALPQWGDMSLCMTQLHAALQSSQIYNSYIYRFFCTELAHQLQHRVHYNTLLAFLSSFLNRETALFSHRFLLSDSQESEAIRTAHNLWETADPAFWESQQCQMAGGHGLCYFFPARDATKALATLCVLCPAGVELSQIDQRLVQALLPHLTSLLMQSVGRMECLYKQTDAFLEAIFQGEFTNCQEQLVCNARYLGMDSQQDYVLWIIDADRSAPISPKRLDEYFSNFHRRFFHIFRSGRLIYLMEWRGQQLDKLYNFCHTLFSSHGGTQKYHVSFSPCFHGLSGIPDAFSQADFAYKIGRKLSHGQIVYSYEEYVIYDFLYSVRHTSAIRSIYEEVISKLKSYDQINNTELLDTLRNLCANNFNAIQTADHMYLHRNSIYKRIDQLREILDIADMEQPDNRMILDLAVKLYDLFC